MAIKTKSDNSSSDSQVGLYDVQDNTISDRLISIGANFYSVSACSQYLLSYAAKNTLRIYNF